MAAGDTIAALSSGALPAGIAVIRTSGPQAMEAAQRLAGKLPPPRLAKLRKLRSTRDGTLIDQALVLCLPGPSSATGEDIVEYHCHGGRATVAALLKELEGSCGLRMAEPGEFTRRAMANGIIDLTAAEGLADLLSAETELQRKVALQRADGDLRREIEAIRLELLDLSAGVEIAIDYADEDEGAGPAIPIARFAALEGRIQTLLSQPSVDKLRTGVRVVVAGPPNAGKSSLINMLAGFERAIVTPIEGTTRDTIEVPLAIDGVPIVLVDTAGLRETDDPVETIGILRTEKELEGADIVLWLGPYDKAPPDSVLIATKADLGGHGVGLETSSVTGEGRARLLDMIGEMARAMSPTGDAVALSDRERGLLSQVLGHVHESSISTTLEIRAELLRQAREDLGRITGRTDVDDVLDALFSRFCVGK